MQNNQAIFELLFKRKFSDPGNKDLLEQISSAHPYFSPAQFYLLQQTKEDSAAFKTQAAKTALLFNNPYWLNFQLQQTKEAPVVELLHALPVDIRKTEEHIPEKEITPIKTEPIPIVPELPEEKNTVAELEQPAKYDMDETEEIIMEKEIEPMKIELKIPAEKNVMDEMPLFEPMHMVDYFASQGIKLSEEVQTGDKLGKQLKSFTEWLKTMKKVHVENQGQAAGQTDTTIQSLAEKSNAGDEVLTVSMADVFAKQGKLDKAREVLEKLSLLNPAKSAYFAAKIESLKEL
ncbi:MAG TPA: hypothetical protein VK484_05980 [Ferruginibacter sp.]|nr:hypothetical protein [Ferruginibacter sp.]